MNAVVASQLASLAKGIKKYRALTGLNQTDFGAIGGVSITTQQQYEAGKTAPTAEYLFRLKEHGADLISLMTEQDFAEPNSALGVLPAELAKFARKGKSEKNPRLDPDMETVEVQEVDLAYGLGGTFADDMPTIQTHRFPRAWVTSITSTPPSMLTFSRGRGDSMQPTIQDGDMVLIDRSQRAVREWDAIWAMTIGEMAMIKRVRVLGEQVHILSDNERVPAENIFHEEINIVGRVIFIGRRL